MPSFRYVNGTILAGFAKVQESGKFSVVTNIKLSSGYYIFTITQATDQGIESFPIAAGQVTILPAPAVGTATFLEGSKVSVSGTAKPDSDVEVSVEGHVIGKIKADSNGYWSLPLSDEIPADVSYPIVLTVTQKDTAGVSDTTTYSVVVIPPVVTDQIVVTGNANSKNAKVDGTGHPGASIVVYLNGSSPFGPAVVEPDGTWTITSSFGLAPGLYLVTANQTYTVGPVLKAVGGSLLIQEQAVSTLGAGATTRAGATTTILAPHTTTIRSTTQSKTATITMTLTPSSTSESATSTSLTQTSSSLSETTTS